MEGPVQQGNFRKDAVKVFIDCSSCDMNFTRQEIPWVNYVRDVTEAQVYVLVTRQNSGNGGNLYTYTFHGMDTYAGMDDTLTYTSNPYEPSTEIRERRTTILKAGLL
jgi:Tfp pilus assembly protein PilX